MSVRELTADADVGRSTFYEHFGSKDDLLEFSVGRMLAVLAVATTTSTSSDALRDMLTHMGAQRALACALLRGSARTILLRVLARELERHLTAIAKRFTAPPLAPLAFLAVSLAHAQLGVVDAWLSGEDCGDASAAARVLHAITQAGVSAMFRRAR